MSEESFFFICCALFVLTTTFSISYPTNLCLEHSEKHQLKSPSFEAILLEKERFHKIKKKRKNIKKQRNG